MPQPIKFKKRFKPQPVEIDGKDEATHRFTTVKFTRAVEREFGEVMEAAGSFDADTTDEDIIDLYLGLVDKLVEPEAGKKTPASKVLKDLWKGEEIESRDIVDFINDVVENRRPT
jgi:hypothetical protein